MKACLALRTSCRFQKFAVGDFRRTQVNGRERWVYLGKFYDLGSELAAYHAAQEKLSALPFVLRQGGAWTVLVDEGSVAPAAVVDPIGLAPPSSFAAALSMLPYILSKEEELSLIEYAKLRLAAIQADFARAAAPAVLDLPPELPETQGADAALPPEGCCNADPGADGPEGPAGPVQQTVFQVEPVELPVAIDLPEEAPPKPKSKKK